MTNATIAINKGTRNMYLAFPCFSLNLNVDTTCIKIDNANANQPFHFATTFRMVSYTSDVPGTMRNALSVFTTKRISSEAVTIPAWVEPTAVRKNFC